MNYLAVAVLVVSVGTANAAGISPDGTTISGGVGEVTSAVGDTWSFGAPGLNRPGEWDTLRNGIWTDGGIADLLEIDGGGEAYAQTKAGMWWLWNGSAWAQSSAPPVPTIVTVAPKGQVLGAISWAAPVSDTASYSWSAIDLVAALPVSATLTSINARLESANMAPLTMSFYLTQIGQACVAGSSLGAPLGTFVANGPVGIRSVWSGKAALPYGSAICAVAEGDFDTSTATITAFGTVP